MSLKIKLQQVLQDEERKHMNNAKFQEDKAYIDSLRKQGLIQDMEYSLSGIDETRKRFLNMAQAR